MWCFRQLCGAFFLVGLLSSITAFAAEPSFGVESTRDRPCLYEDELGRQQVDGIVVAYGEGGPLVVALRRPDESGARVFAAVSLATGACRHFGDAPNTPQDALLSPGSRFFATRYQNEVTVYDLASGQLLAVFTVPNDSELLHFSPDGRLLVSRLLPFGGVSGSIQITEVATGETRVLPSSCRDIPRGTEPSGWQCQGLVQLNADIDADSQFLRVREIYDYSIPTPLGRQTSRNMVVKKWRLADFGSSGVQFLRAMDAWELPGGEIIGLSYGGNLGTIDAMGRVDLFHGVRDVKSVVPIDHDLVAVVTEPEGSFYRYVHVFDAATWQRLGTIARIQKQIRNYRYLPADRSFLAYNSIGVVPTEVHRFLVPM